MSEQDVLTGELLDGKYRIGRLLGQGGMGAVYRATHLGTKRTVAVKVIRPRLSASREFVERFRREAEAAGRLRHPNVVDVTDFGFARIGSGQVGYLVMEYLDGCTLAEVLAEESRLPTGWVVDILEQVCSAVDEAHRLGVIHRDLKPENIWLEPNRRGAYTIKVLDFGLAKLGSSTPAEAESSRSTAGHSASAVRLATPAEAHREETARAVVSTNSVATETPTLMLAPAAEESPTLIGPAEPVPFEQPAVNESFVPTLLVSGNEPGRRRTPVSTIGAEDSVEKVSADDLTRVGSVMGTPLYMSPEQCLGQPLDTRSDIYSLGVIAYRMLAGATPFTGNFDELKRLHSTSVPEHIRTRNPKVPRRMARVVMAALAKDPAKRPESAAGFGSALRAGMEGSGALLRHATALYSEHFPTFLKISLIAHAPLIALVALIYFFENIVPVERLGPSAGSVLWPLAFLGIVAASLIAYFAGSAVTIPIVVQLMVAPLRPVSVRTALAALRRRWWPFSATSLVVEGMILVGAVFFVVPGVVAAICYVLYAPVVVMEGSGVRATLKRARSLMKRSWSTVLIITVLQFALPVLVWVASIDTAFTLKLADDWSPKEFGFNFSMSGYSSLFQLLNVFVMPLAAITVALLYLKTRQAGGESLADAVAQFDALEIPRSRWQARMRSRSISRTSSGHTRDDEREA